MHRVQNRMTMPETKSWLLATWPFFRASLSFLSVAGWDFSSLVSPMRYSMPARVFSSSTVPRNSANWSSINGIRKPM